MESKLSRAGRQLFALVPCSIFEKHANTASQSQGSSSALCSLQLSELLFIDASHSSDVEADNLTLSAYCCNFANVQSLWRAFVK